MGDNDKNNSKDSDNSSSKDNDNNNSKDNASTNTCTTSLNPCGNPIYNVDVHNYSSGITVVGDRANVYSGILPPSSPVQGADRSRAIVHRVSEFVRDDYHRTYKWMRPYTWGQNMAISKFFVSVVLEGVNGGVQRNSNHLLDKIFTINGGESCNRVFLCGSPGIGKTTLCQKLVYDWACRETERPIRETERSIRETERSSSETRRPIRETERSSSETVRPIRESERSSNETGRPVRETEQSSRETGQPSSGTERFTTETKRSGSETSRFSCESQRPTSETTWSSNETEFEVVVFLKLNGAKGNFKEIMERQILCGRLNVAEKDLFYEYMNRHPKRFLFILDGINECNMDGLPDVKAFLKDECYRGVFLIATSRPELRMELMDVYIDHFRSHYSVKGFSREDVFKFIENYLGDDKQKCSDLKEALEENTDLMDLGRIPLLTPIICELSKENELPTLTNVTKLLTHYVKVVQTAFCKKNAELPGIGRKESVVEECLSSLGKLALHGVRNNTMQYPESKLQEYNIDVTARQLGFLNTEPHLDTALTQKKSVHLFAHKSIQEFMAARWLTRKWSSQEARDVVEEMLQDISKSYSVLVFISGLLSQIPYSNKTILREFFQKLCGDVFKEGCYNDVMQLALACCNEAWTGDDGSFIAYLIDHERSQLFKKVETNWGFTLHMTVEEVRGLSFIMPLMPLTTLEMSGILIQTREAKLLAKICLKENTSLKAVKFSYCCLSPGAVEAICASLESHSELEILDFSCCNLSNSGMLAVARLLNDENNINSLRLGNFPATLTKQRSFSRKRGHIAAQPAQNGSNRIMNTLFAFHNQLGSSQHDDDAIQALMDAVRDSKTLKELSLLCCHVGDRFSEWLKVFRENQQSLKTLKIQLPQLDDKCYDELKKFFKDMLHNQKITVIYKKDERNSDALSNDSVFGNRIVFRPWNLESFTAQSWTDLVYDSFFPDQSR